MLCWFCSEFYRLSSSANNFENRLRFDKVTESFKVGPFLETQYVRHLETHLCQVMSIARAVVKVTSHWLKNCLQVAWLEQSIINGEMVSFSLSLTLSSH